MWPNMIKILLPIVVLSCGGVSLSPECRVGTEPPDPKISGQLAADVAQGRVPKNVLVGMNKSLDFQSLPTCANGASTCPERDAAFAELDKSAADSQRCAQEQVRALGGVVLDSFTMGNAFSAQLDANGVREIAARVDVRSVEGDYPTPPP